jgi:hypothetical protein
MTVGAAVANADLLGIGGGDGVEVLGVHVIGGSEQPRRSGGGVSSPTARVSGVSTAPSARTVVIRAEGPAAQPDLSLQQAAVPAVVRSVPVADAVPAAPPPAAPPAAAPEPLTGPLPAPPPAAPLVVRPPAPEGIPISTTKQPGPSRGIGPAKTFPPPTRVPDSFRVGYAEYLRSASTSDLLAAALPGVAGLAGFTIAGAYAGYRQAKAVQQALLAPVPTSILL